MDEYTCQKCGEVCVIEYMHDKSFGWPDAWCETCSDYPEGFQDKQMELQVDYISVKADWAYEQAKERRLYDAASPEERKRVTRK